MKLSINTVVHGLCPNREYFTIGEALQILKKTGFDAADINLASAISDGNFMQSDDWRDEILRIKEEGEGLGLEMSQAHLPFYYFLDSSVPELDFKKEITLRTVEACGMLGIKWAVFHAGNDLNAVMSAKESKRGTVEYLKPIMELAEKCEVGIAVENLFVPNHIKRQHRYCATVEEVIDLVDTVGGNIGVCWDFGHANLVGDDQTECLRAISKRLKCMHVHDNNGTHDDHMLPYSYHSTVDWARILPVLSEIGYQGNFNFEVAIPNMPENLREITLTYIAALGREMMRLTGI